LRIIGSFGLKLSPNGFAISLTRSNHRPINAPWAHSSKRNKADREREHLARLIRHIAG